MTWPQSVGNRISEDLISKFSVWGCPQTLLQGTAFGGPNFEPSSVKSWIRHSMVCKALWNFIAHYWNSQEVSGYKYESVKYLLSSLAVKNRQHHKVYKRSQDKKSFPYPTKKDQWNIKLVLKCRVQHNSGYESLGILESACLYFVLFVKI